MLIKNYTIQWIFDVTIKYELYLLTRTHARVLKGPDLSNASNVLVLHFYYILLHFITFYYIFVLLHWLNSTCLDDLHSKLLECIWKLIMKDHGRWNYLYFLSEIQLYNLIDTVCIVVELIATHVRTFSLFSIFRSLQIFEKATRPSTHERLNWSQIAILFLGIDIFGQIC